MMSGNGDADSTRDEEGRLIIPSVHNFMKELECPICMTTFGVPIYQCTNGHSMCSDCMVNNFLCPQCTFPMTQKRNYSLEAILSQVEDHCGNEGCDVRMLCIDLRAHSKVCPFRPVICKYRVQTACYGRPIPYEKFIQHLQKEHLDATDISDVCSITLSTDVVSSGTIAEWNPSIFQCLDQWFIANIRKEGNYVAISVLYFGSQQDAEKYKCQIFMGSNADLMVHCVDVLVNSFREMEKDPPLFSVKLPTRDFTRFGTTTKDKDTGVNQVAVRMKFCISPMNEIQIVQE